MAGTPMKSFEFRYDGNPSLLSGSVTPPSPLYALMRSAPRVNPNVAVNKSVGVSVCVSFNENKCADPLLGPPAQGSAKFPKQLYEIALFHSCEYLALSKFFSLNR